MHQWRYAGRNLHDSGGRTAEPLLQCETSLNDTMCGPASWKRLVRKLSDEPAPTEVLGDARGIAARLDQLEVAERAFENVLGAFEPTRGRSQATTALWALKPICMASSIDPSVCACMVPQT